VANMTCCPECGPDPICDEDGCCAMCGSDVCVVPNTKHLESHIAELEKALAEALARADEGWSRERIRAEDVAQVERNFKLVGFRATGVATVVDCAGSIVQELAELRRAYKATAASEQEARAALASAQSVARTLASIVRHNCRDSLTPCEVRVLDIALSYDVALSYPAKEE
jgi:hypothetical protein